MVRIAAIPLLLLSLLPETPGFDLVAAGIYSLGAITDIVDGYLARRMNKTSRLGKLLDPLADKLLVITAFVMLVEAHRLSGLIVVVFLSREFVVTGLRGIASAEGIVIAADKWGKFKATFQNLGNIGLLMGSANTAWGCDWALIGLVLLCIGLVFALYSGVNYLYKFLNAVASQ